MHIVRALMVLGLVSAAVATASEQNSKRPDAKPEYRTEFTCATMSDGVKIALAVAYPRGFDADQATASASSAPVRNGLRSSKCTAIPIRRFPSRRRPSATSTSRFARCCAVPEHRAA